jgi:uncharacterized membrane protein YqiK
MWTVAVIVGGLVIAGMILSSVPRAPKSTRPFIVLAALGVLFAAVFASSFRYVGENQVGIVIKNVGASLPPGQIIATAGEKGPQAGVLPPGWHSWLWPVIYDVQVERIIEIGQDEIGILTARDGQPLPAGSVYAPEWADGEVKNMLNAQYFLTDGGGYKGPQASVLTPGKHRLNTRLFAVEKAPVTNVRESEAGVVKSNVGDVVSMSEQSSGKLVPKGNRGIWTEPYGVGKYYLNPKAYEITIVSTRNHTVQYTKSKGTGVAEQREITVRSSDGFTFPVDVRVEYTILPENAPIVIAHFQDAESEALNARLHSKVRSVFRNNAETLKALDYVNSRSQQESQSEAKLAELMLEDGLTITGVRIGDVGDEQTLGPLLKTQTDREIALQEQVTFQEQQRAAEQQKALTRTQQEALEEKRLATAQYQVQIAEQQKQQRIIAAQAEAESIRIEAEAQAEAFRVIAMQIGQGNAALMELMKIIGERGIAITPRVMVTGGQSGSSNAETTALIGTMLDSMVSKEPAQN